MKKTSWLIAILICLLIIGGGAAVVLCPRIVFPSQCSELYKRYANTEGIDATFIKGFRINDTIFVDVTVLEATDSIGWNELRVDFKFLGCQKENSKRMGKNISYKYAPKKDYTKNTDTTSILNNDCIAICVFSSV